MQVSLETTSGLERRLTIVIPAEKVDGEVAKRLNDMSRRVRLDGFRPGKVPAKVMKRRYGLGARQEVLGEQMQQAFVEAVTQEKLNPAGAPTVEPKADEEGKDFEFVATFEVYPEIALGDFASIEVERPVADVKDADIDEMVETLRNQSKTFEDVERAAENGDQIVFDYVGTKGGEEFEGGKAENSTLELGSGRMIPGFEDGLVGVSAGEEKTLELTFPEEYHSEELKGQAVEFACKVHKVQAASMPELNDEFFARFGVSEGGQEAFRAEVRKNMERELRQAVKGKVKNQVMDGLLATNEIEVPSPLVAQEIDRMREQAVQQFGGAQGGFDPKQLPAELFEADAKKRVALGLIVGEVVKQREVKVDDDRVRAMIEEMASAYQEPQQVIDWYYSNEQQLSQVKYVVLEEQVVDTVLENAKVSEAEVSYQDAIKPAAPEAAEEQETAEEA
ncbi:trigger factor [Endozoicomonas montiporae]|uniref:Trigger factor n=2 Tax=Endozoicomonas montiporae TaxID=1027273 RepID=A0A081NBZ5_9GAMM|nr:trigger factor [Endozoicomonas montiporae]AMO56288.1 trigger factor [Endozoicomonas montiporae CL-33]KEQ15968.1 trigger factor [Endozoicomonas montiporae]